MWGSSPTVAALNSFAFVSQISIDNGGYCRLWCCSLTSENMLTRMHPHRRVASAGTIASYNLNKKAIGVKNCRNISKKDMKWNDQTPTIKVNPETFRVEADGVHCTCEPAQKLPLAQGYFLF